MAAREGTTRAALQGHAAECPGCALREWLRQLVLRHVPAAGALRSGCAARGRVVRGYVAPSRCARWRDAGRARLAERVAHKVGGLQHLEGPQVHDRLKVRDQVVTEREALELCQRVEPLHLG